MTPRRVCLVGVRGVGKTTLVRSVLPRLPGVDHVVGSAVLRELVGESFARFDHLPPEVKQAYRRQAIGWMEARQAREQRAILCDGHTSLLDESTGRVEPVFTREDCLFFRELVLVEAPLATVMARRAQDTSKRRSLDPGVIAAEIEGERQTAARIASEWGMSLHRASMLPAEAAADRLVEFFS